MTDTAAELPALSKVQRSFHTQVIFGTSFTFLTSGVFLSGLAIYMGASDLLVSYISMITNICGISILLFSSFMERFYSYRKITIGLTVLSKAATLLIVLIPVLIPANLQIIIFIPVMVTAFTLQAQTTVILNNWMVTFVEEKKSGRYIAVRQTFVLGATVILSLAGGRLLDAVSGAYIGFIILFSVAMLMGVMEILTLLRIPDTERRKIPVEKSRFSDMVLLPIKNRLFLAFVVYIFFFYLMLSIADSFTVVYMMRYLKLSYVTTTGMQMLISLPQVFLLGVWGKVSDRRGHQFALTASIWFFIGETFFMALSNPHNFYFFIPVAFLFASAANAGFMVSVFNRRYELMPVEGRILYDNFYSAAVGLAFILGPVIGGGVKRFLESSSWLAEVIQFGNIRLLYAISTAAIILLQILMMSVKSKGCKITLEGGC
ncbi:MAG: MFS transporter [Clostridiales bacterium]|nr:MFS transporter [Clostridiales bacterium]MDU3242040.1 MFS transporter [Clostridiales bacterium]